MTSRLRQGAAGVQELYIDGSRNDVRTQDLLKLASDHAVRTITVDVHRLDGLTGNARHQGVAARVAAVQPRQDLEAVLDSIVGVPLLLILDGVQDPHNLGACLRVADAFGVHAVIAPKDRAVGITPVVSKVAVTNLARTMRELKERNIWIVGADGAAEQGLYACKLNGPMAWVLGAEGEGMRRLTRENCDELVRIPMLGTVESLNVSVASGVCLGETLRQRNVSI